MTDAHWHFYRMRWATLTAEDTTATVDVDLFFALDRFSTTTLACAALAEDIVDQYPSAKRLPLIEQVRTDLPDHPGGGVRYHDPRDGPVIWKLVDCTGHCHDTGRETEKEIGRALAERTGISLLE